MKTLALTLAVLCGNCTHAPRDAPPLAPREAPLPKEPVFAPAPHYAGLFQRRGPQRLRVETRLTVVEDDGEGNVSPSEKIRVSSATCELVDKRSTPNEMAGMMRCTGALENAAVSDTVPVCGPFLESEWRTDRRGLWKKLEPVDRCWHPPEEDAGLLLSAEPVPVKSEHTFPNEEGGYSRVVEKQGQAWCVTDASWSGDDAADSFCFRDGILVYGSRFFGGGSTREIRFCIGDAPCTMPGLPLPEPVPPPRPNP